MQDEIFFHEEQKFNQWWIMLIVYGVAALNWWGFIQQIVFGEPWGNNPAPDWMMWLLWLAFGIGLPIAWNLMKLETTVDQNGVHIRLWPFSKRDIPFEEIVSSESRQYSPIKEYGGWGVRHRGSKRAYNASGDMGVELELRDGRIVLVGTQEPEAFISAMRQHS